MGHIKELDFYPTFYLSQKAGKRLTFILRKEGWVIGGNLVEGKLSKYYTNMVEKD